MKRLGDVLGQALDESIRAGFVGGAAEAARGEIPGGNHGRKGNTMRRLPRSWQVVGPLSAALVLANLLGGRADEAPAPPKGEPPQGAPGTGESPLDREAVAFFEQRIRPLLVARCYACHSAEAKELEGGLRLDSPAAVRQGGSSGPAIVPGDPDKSLLIRAVRYEDENLQMPPDKKLSAAEIADLTAWVKMGAPDPRDEGRGGAFRVGRASADHWSLRPVTSPALPRVRDAAWPTSPVDRFILARLEANNVAPVEPADKRTLLRRTTFDLTGLPPDPQDVDDFLADPSPDAFSRVLDRLLASPAYGERWARHWMDVVRYSDTAGDNSDYPIPQMYRYRNWIIQAFRRDMPYDDFVRAQLAGDLLPAADEAQRRDNLVATGYLANARRFGSYEDARYPWHLTIEDTIDNLGRTFLGLSIHCCRCHDHKFDPLTSEDYYALYGFFQSTRYPWPGIELDKVQRDLVPLASAAEAREAQERRRAELAAFDSRIADLEAKKKDGEQALKDAAAIADQNERASRINAAAMRLDQLKQSIKTVREERERAARKPTGVELAYAVAEGKSEGKKRVGNAHVQIKGDPERPGREVPRRFLAVLGGAPLPPNVKGSGRRELAHWIVDPANPLTARVMVNRLWHYHFGRGIVPTPSDFGQQGRPPTHPELLDFLARRFVESDWSIKRMHRLMMHSTTYQLSSRADERRAQADPDNNLVWRFRRRRLEAEAIRDAMLWASGELDRSMGQAHPFPPEREWNFTQHSPFKAVYDSNRRSVYLMTQRIQRHPYLGLFDGSDTNAGTDRRSTSTTSLQSLYLMNDSFVHEQARKLAARLLREGRDDPARIDRAHRLLYGRPAAPEEVAEIQSYLSRLKERPAGRDPDPQQDSGELRPWQSAARALLATSEFVYLD